MLFQVFFTFTLTPVLWSGEMCIGGNGKLLHDMMKGFF